MNKTLFVGCGGSGVTTLLRVNEMLASNPETRNRIREDISYLVIDTEVLKIVEFVRTIRRQMDNKGMPVILPIRMTDGYHKLSEIVSPNFEHRDSESLELLKPHWWFTPDEGEKTGRPFSAINLPGDIMEGASQCPPVSYLATWNFLPQLKDAITKLLVKIRMNNTDEAEPLSNLRVFIVTSLAGGTGRGCWNLIAFKIRQCLKELGASTGIMTGLFFDASCFPNVTDVEFKRSLRMNSLTGMSELSAWLRLPNEAKADFRYSLPFLSNPDPDPEMGVISVPEDAAERTPVTTAFLVFGKNDGGVELEENDQYYEMAAAALYSLVATGNSISATGNNRLERVRSFASTTFEVETVALKRYLRTRVQLDYTHRLWEGDTKTSTEALDCAGDTKNGNASDSYKESFFGKTGFFVPDRAQDFTRGGTGGDTQSLLTRLMARAEEQITDEKDLKNGEKRRRFISWYDIEQSLRDSESAEAQAKSRAALTTLEEDVVRGWEKALDVCGLDEKNLPLTLRNAVRSSFFSEGKKDEDINQIIGELPPSVARARKMTALLIEEFKSSLQNLTGTPDSPVTRKLATTGETLRSPSDCADCYEPKIDERSDRKFKHALKMFGQDEIDELEQFFNEYKRESIFFFLLDYLKSKFKRAKKILEAFDASLATLELGLKDTEEKFRDELCAAFKKTDVDLIFGELFTDDNDNSIFDALPAANSSSQKAYRRTLKPIMKDNEVKALLAKPSLISTPLADQLKKELDKLIGGGDETPYAGSEDARCSIRDTFAKLVKDNVGLPKVSGGDFMSSHFSFESVLENNREKWNRLLKNWTDTDKEDELLDRIRLFLGVAKEDMDTVPVGDRTVWRIPKQVLLPSIVGSLAAVCRPWMQLFKKKAKFLDLSNTFALVPAELNEEDNEMQYFANQVKKVSNRDENKEGLELDFILKNRDVKICHRGDDGGNRLPLDRVLVFSEVGVSLPAPDDVTTPSISETPVGSAFELIASLDYWREAQWTPLLARAEVILAQADRETVKGDAYFVRNPSPYSDGWMERERTYGYVSPIFLTNAILKDLRWKPWARKEVRKDDANQRRNEAMSALLFGLLGSGVETALKSAVEKKGWTGFPLLKMPGTGKGAESLVFQRTSRVDELAWNEKFVLGTTLEKAVDFLLGIALPGEAWTSESEERSKRGARIRKALLDEKKAFDTVLLALAEEDRKAIRDALGQFLAEQARSRRSNPKLWEELYKAWEAGR